MWTCIAPILLLTITVLTKTSQPQSIMWPREICITDIKRRACDLGKPLGGEREKAREKSA